MKRFIFFFSIYLISVTAAAPLGALAAADDARVSPADLISQAAVLMDAETGQILFQKAGESLMYPASVTKIMTGLLAVENSDMGEIAEVQSSAVEIDVWDSSNIALSAGERLPVDSLMYGMMLESGNDAANALAEHVAGNQSDFAQRMTERAWSVGANSTRFLNAHGLHEPGHYTTALDIAKITREAIKNPVFMRYFGADLHTIPGTNLQPLERPFTNRQYMLVDTTSHYDPRVTGGKVGYTLEARHTMSSSAEQDGRTLVCVVMNSPQRYDKFKDTALLLDYGFTGFKKVTFPKDRITGFETEITENGKKTATVKFFAEEDFTALVPNGADESAISLEYINKGPFEPGEQPECELVFSLAQENSAFPARLGSLKLAAEVIPVSPPTLPSAAPEKDSGVFDGPWFIPAVISAVAAGTSIAALAVRRAKLNRRRRRRRERIARMQREQTIRR